VAEKETVIVTGAGKGIGAAVVKAFLDRNYNVVANSLTFSESNLRPSPALALVDGDIGRPETALRAAETAVSRFGSINHVVNNAGIFTGRPFTDYTIDEFRRFASINVEGFILMTQQGVKQMLAQGSGGSVTTITAALADNPMAGSPASIPMITKGGLNAVTVSLASEYAKQKIRFNAVAPSAADTPMHRETPRDVMRSLTPMGEIVEAKDIAEAVVYLAEARFVTGEVLHVDGGAHAGRW
jgi:NAD(P)-dependent dehydrogenase (short-subunit alcohol dehydrogenase family)